MDPELGCLPPPPAAGCTESLLCGHMRWAPAPVGSFLLHKRPRCHVKAAASRNRLSVSVPRGERCQAPRQAETLSLCPTPLPTPTGSSLPGKAGALQDSSLACSCRGRAGLGGCALPQAHCAPLGIFRGETAPAAPPRRPALVLGLRRGKGLARALGLGLRISWRSARS